MPDDIYYPEPEGNAACRICGRKLANGDLCVPCGRKMNEPCGITRNQVRAADSDELEWLQYWVNRELEHRGIKAP